MQMIASPDRQEQVEHMDFPMTKLEVERPVLSTPYRDFFQSEEFLMVKANQRKGKEWCTLPPPPAFDGGYEHKPLPDLRDDATGRLPPPVTRMQRFKALM